MKYILLFCFLIALSHSKLPKISFKSFLENLNSDFDEEDPCRTQKDKASCLAFPSVLSYAQCCYIKAVDDGIPNEECQLSPKPLKDITDIVKAKQFDPLTREVYGFMKYGSGEDVPDASVMKVEVNCPDGDLEFSFEGYKYTDDEAKTLASEDHCLYYTLSSFMDPTKKGYVWENGKLLKSAKDADIECGNLAVTVKSGSTETSFKTCMLVAYDMFSKMNMPKILNEQIKEMISEGADKVVVELSDSKGRTIKYDSETGKIIANNSSILTISKYLFLLILFLF